MWARVHKVDRIRPQPNGSAIVLVEDERNQATMARVPGLSVVIAVARILNARKVLDELRSGIGLSASDVRWSSAILREYGNLSSPFVLFVLDAALRGRAPGGLWWMSSFGAGFSCHGALLEVA